MLYSCRKCGKVHNKSFICTPRVYAKKEYTNADRFRNSRTWRNKRQSIKDRDKALCLVCINDLYCTHKLNYNTKIEVHHITPLHEDYNLRLADDNLICLCPHHHKMAERGDIPRKELKELVKNAE